MPSQEPPSSPVPHDPYAAWRYRNFQLYAVGNLAWWVGQLMTAVAVDWQVYQLTHSATALGLVGLCGAIPVILLAIPAGHLADRFNRRNVFLLAAVLSICCALGLAAISYSNIHIPSFSVLDGANHLLARTAELFPGDNGAHFDNPVVPLLFLLLFLSAVAIAIGGPSRSALLPNVIPLEVFSNAVTWNVSSFQISAMSGPALAGVLLAHFHDTAYAYSLIYMIDACCVAILIAALLAMRYVHVPRPGEPASFKALIAGIHFVFNKKIILATITLDLFAVLLGGAVALLPIFADQILHQDASALGWLRAAPAAGAFVMALTVAHRPPMKHAGKTLLLAVAGFGVATIIFGLSTNFWLSMAMLAATGACDNISVVVRHTLVQVLTPDVMRGRVSAVNNVFIGASNELGAFESGITAAAFGPIASVVGGGIGTILVVLGVAFIWPQVAAFGSLHDARPEDDESTEDKIQKAEDSRQETEGRSKP